MHGAYSCHSSDWLTATHHSNNLTAAQRITSMLLHLWHCDVALLHTKLLLLLRNICTTHRAPHPTRSAASMLHRAAAASLTDSSTCT
jgi:hypothetical protein